MRHVRAAFVIGFAAVVTASGGVAYAASADAAPASAMACRAVHHDHLQIVDGTGSACQMIVDELARGTR